jgi:hypothetical protein
MNPKQLALLIIAPQQVNRIAYLAIESLGKYHP